MSWPWLALGYYFAGVFFGLVALFLRSERGPLPSGAGVFGLIAFIVAWPVLLVPALLAHLEWLIGQAPHGPGIRGPENPPASPSPAQIPVMKPKPGGESK